MCNTVKEEAGGSTQKPAVGEVPSIAAQPSSKRGRLWTQVAACMAASLGTLSAGAVNGWTAGTLPSMKEDPSIYLGTAETAWMVGIVALGALVGSLIAGQAMDRFGRRTTIVWVSPIMAASWVLMALAPYISIILLGRAICGLMTSFLISAVSVYNSEVPEARLRGRLGTMSSLFISLGILFSYTAGAFLPWRYSCYVCAAPPVLTAFVVFAVPESPYWLMLKGRKNEALVALKWLRGPDYDIMEDLENIDLKLKAVGTKIQYRELLRPRTRRPFFIALFLMTLQQTCGANILIMYTGSILISAGVKDHNTAVVYVGLVQLVGTIFSVLLMDKLGRRLIIVTSLSVVGIFTVMLGVYYYMQVVMSVVWPLWVPLTAVMVSSLGYCFGCRTIPWLTSAELFNTTIRSTANTVCLLYNRILNFTIVQVYPFLVEAIGAHSVFFFFGGVSLVGSVLSSIIMPETKGKSLEQIQEYFEKKNLKASESKNKKSGASEDDTKKTCCNDQSMLSSVSVATSPITESACVITQEEEMTKL
ncbi:facilitated trehalose transporter Tret1-like isoform X2 [Eriocheir sinensis]|nr:facilitated trehalose transporter Tret1-like isoform X2 [Eriocheir sinensis]XP_050695631.1 facilitated trehalose transporter Tret1-like isoform X2 [Eriocheir sinensis]